jgi:uncharacterized iron-regulated membrane protein
MEPGGVRGVICDVVPSGDDMVAWFGVGWIIVLLTGFYLWYWPGVRRWARAFRIQRKRGPFAFNMSLHKVIGLIVWVPLLAIAFTGIAFAFPSLSNWYERATPAQRGFYLWSPSEDLVSSPPEDGAEPIGLDAAVAAIEDRFPDRTVEGLLPPWDETAPYSAWVTRGYSPWLRPGSEGNVYVLLDQYTGEVLYDGTPEEGNVFDQAWDDWSFPVHAGDMGGVATRVVWAVLGVATVALGVTGLTMNLIRRQKRARRA